MSEYYKAKTIEAKSKVIDKIRFSYHSFASCSCIKIEGTIGTIFIENNCEKCAGTYLLPLPFSEIV